MATSRQLANPQSNSARQSSLGDLPKLALIIAVGIICPVQASDAQDGSKPPDAAEQDASQQVYTQPQFFPGSLFVSTVKQLSPRQTMLVEKSLQPDTQNLVLLNQGTDDEQSAVARFLRERAWQNAFDHSATSDQLATNRQQIEADLLTLKTGGCVYVAGAVVAELSKDDLAWMSGQLQTCASRGATVWIDASRSSADGDGRPVDDIWATQLTLVPEVHFAAAPKTAAHEEARSSDEALTVELPEEGFLRARERELTNLSEEGSLTVRWPATTGYPQSLEERVTPRNSIDGVAAKRALVERRQPTFPATTAYNRRLSKGSLVIVGGGGATAEIWEKFIALAGGKDAHLVILPTAAPEPESQPAELRTLKRLGASNIRVLPNIDRDEVSRPEFLEALERADGVWFGGGRQWRFIDAYWGTPAWSAIINVVYRGGVIGGSSAGATIQGELLVRGSPLGNHIMVADGYRRGLGLLSGTAIDQHFSQRNRFDDLASVVQRFPAILGIGIDESTALVVEAPDRCSVLGKASVWLSRPPGDFTSTSDTQAERKFIEYTSGSQFELNVR